MNLLFPILLITILCVMTSSAFAQSSNVTIVDKPKDTPKEKPKVKTPKDKKAKIPKNCDNKRDSKNNTVIICKNTIVKTVKEPSHIVIKTVKISPKISSTFASNLLLLDSKQLCLIASDLQCVASQSHFLTSSLSTSYDSSSKTWSISGTVKNVGKQELKNIVVTAILYDSSGTPIGQSVASSVSPSSIQSFDDGNFNLIIKGKDAMFIVLSYS